MRAYVMVSSVVVAVIAGAMAVWAWRLLRTHRESVEADLRGPFG